MIFESRIKHRNSFTLIELLVVLAIVAILSVVVIMTLNPAELVKQARDSTRLSDLSTLNTALAAFAADVTNGFAGTSTVVYVSIPDVSQTCVNLGLPSLPSGYAYNCVTSANLRKTNGTGWIPVNLGSISFGSPLSALPVDPINTTSSRNFYTYISGGSFEISATLEAAKNKLGGSSDKTSQDGGNMPDLYEAGNNKLLLPLDYGDPSLVGYWNFEEGTTSTVPDRSGYGNNGAWAGAGAHYVSGKVGNYTGQFNGTDDNVTVPSSLVVPSSNFTVSLWFYLNQTAIDRGSGQTLISNLGLYQHPSNNLIYFGVGSRYMSWQPVAGTWHHLICSVTSAGTPDYVTDYQSACYGDGVLRTMNQAGYFAGSTGETIGYTFAGRIDDVRIFKRALSATEEIAMYNSTK